MRKTLLLLLIATGVAGFIGLRGKGSTPLGGPPTFYVSSTSGSDSNPGTQLLPWQSIAKVNSQSFSVNSTILFKGGETFNGGLVFTPSNAPSGNITISSYGTGQAAIASGSLACVHATNLPSMTVNNIACSGSGSTHNATDGILIENSQYIGVPGQLPGPTITNNTINNYGANDISVLADNGGSFNPVPSAGLSGFNTIVINGNTLSNSCGNSSYAGNYATGISVLGAASDITRYDINNNITVQNNTVSTCQQSTLHPTAQGGGFGMNFQYATTVLIQNNLVHDNGGATTAGIVVLQVKSATIQFNEVYNQTNCNPGVGGLCEDGYGIDMDSGTQNSVVQYNYVHDNLFGNINACDCNATLNDNNVIRFNLAGSGINTSGINVSVGSVGVTNLAIYNNTLTPGSCIVGGSSTVKFTVTIANNICGDPGGSTMVINVAAVGSTVTLAGNDYPGSPNPVVTVTPGCSPCTSLAALQAAGFEKVSGNPVGTTANPNLTGPVSPTTVCGGYNGICPTNYDLTTASPAGKGNGLNLNTIFSYNVGTQDFYGNILTAGTLPIGAAANM